MSITAKVRLAKDSLELIKQRNMYMLTRAPVAVSVYGGESPPQAFFIPQLVMAGSDGALNSYQAAGLFLAISAMVGEGAPF